MTRNIELLYTILSMISYVVFGYFLKCKNTFTEKTIQQLNKLVFSYCFPINIAMSFYGTRIREILNSSFLIYIVVTFLLTMVLSFIIAKRMHPDSLTRTVSAVAMFRGNFIIMSFPILSALFGPTSLALGGIVVALSQFLYNFVATYSYESATTRQTDFKNLMIQVLKSPMVLGVFAGILINLFHVNLLFFQDPLKSIGSMGTPLALIILGYGFTVERNPQYLKDTLIVSFVKLLVLPLSALLLGHFFDLSILERGVGIVLFGAPTAVNSYTFAKNYRANEALAQNYVIYTTIFYIFTIYLVILIL